MAENVPEEQKTHIYSGKYKLVTNDEELGVPLYDEVKGFVVDTFGHPFVSPAHFNTSYDSLDDMHHNTMEKGDYLLCSPVKTGQHWVYEIMRMLLAGEATYKGHGKESLWIDMMPINKIYEEHKKPRILCTHITPGWLPEKFTRSDTKVVVTMRNFKDAFVSYHCFMKSSRAVFYPDLPTPAEPEYWNNRFKTLLHSKHVVYGNLFDALADSWDTAKGNSNVHIVFYENLKLDSSSEIEKLAKHMGVSYTQELINEIADAVQIDNMRTEKKKSAMNIGPIGKLNVYRKGQVGDWKNWFTVAQNEEFHRKFDEWNKERQIPMRFV